MATETDDEVFSEQERGWKFDGVTLPPEEYRVHVGKLDKKVLSAEGVEWHGRMAVMTKEQLCFSSVKKEVREYWPTESGVTLANLRKVFEDADVDRSGYLDVAEVKGCLGVLNMPNNDQTVAILMEQLDPDGSGTLDWEEFQVLAKQAAWSNMVVDYIPLAETLGITFEIVDKGSRSLKKRQGQAVDESDYREQTREDSDDEDPSARNNAKGKKRRKTKPGACAYIINHFEILFGMDIDGDGQGAEHLKIPPIDPETQEVQLIILTVADGHNSGRSYIYRVHHNLAQEWLDLLLQYSSEARSRHEKNQLKETYGDSKFSYIRARCKQLYNGPTFQTFAAFMIGTAFVIDMAEAQILPEEGTIVAQNFFLVDLIVSSIFTLELVLNIFSHSENWCHDFLAQKSNLFDFFIVLCQLLSIFIVIIKSTIPNAKLLRTLRIVRVLRLFSRFEKLNKLIAALSVAFGPVCNAFFILIVVTAIYAIFGTHYFRDESPKYFLNFKTSMFSMFQVVTGDSWASGIARDMFQDSGSAGGPDGEYAVDSDVIVFLVTYIFLCTVVLLNVVIAVLLDEFIAFIAQEKQAVLRQHEAELEKMRVYGCLDPLTKTLIAFNDEPDLMNKIDTIYQRLDNDDSGGLNFEEFRQGLKHMTIKDRYSEGYQTLDIHLTRDDFDVVTENGALLGNKGEFNRKQFQSMMRGELVRYTRRQIANGLFLSESEEFRSTVMLMKLLEVEQRASFQGMVEQSAQDRREMLALKDEFGAALQLLRAHGEVMYEGKVGVGRGGRSLGDESRVAGPVAGDDKRGLASGERAQINSMNHASGRTDSNRLTWNEADARIEKVEEEHGEMRARLEEVSHQLQDIYALLGSIDSKLDGAQAAQEAPLGGGRTRPLSQTGGGVGREKRDSRGRKSAKSNGEANKGSSSDVYSRLLETLSAQRENAGSAEREKTERSASQEKALAAGQMKLGGALRFRSLVSMEDLRQNDTHLQSKYTSRPTSLNPTVTRGSRARTQTTYSENGHDGHKGLDMRAGSGRVGRGREHLDHKGDLSDEILFPDEITFPADITFVCQFQCGFLGSYESVQQHEKHCKAAGVANDALIMRRNTQTGH